MLALRLQFGAIALKQLQPQIALAAEIVQSTSTSPTAVNPNTDPESLQTYATTVAEAHGLNVKRYKNYAQKRATEEGLDFSVISNVIECESHWKADAVSITHDIGIVQINPPSWPKITREQMRDPYFSIDFMVSQFKQGHQSYWVCWEKLYG